MTSLLKLVEKITANYPDTVLEPADTFYWSPAQKIVFYNPNSGTNEGLWALLHETGHAALGHERYFTDIELLKMEMQAWEEAKQIALKLQLASDGGRVISKNNENDFIDENHIQDCLDSYRDWLHKRSLCPDCHLSGIQTDEQTYSCVFCHKKWHVSADRFCRPYRKNIKK